MDPSTIINGLILYLTLLVLLTFHEFGHAWTAWKCGDDTAYLRGRVSLNPLAHIDIVGTVILPLLLIFLPGGFFIGWAKPVPVNIHNLRNRRRDDLLVTLAGPGMNLLLAIGLIGLARLGGLLHLAGMMEVSLAAAQLSLMLCFFNLLPIPPLDGSQVVRNLAGISHETYYRVAQYGFIILIIALQMRPVQYALASITNGSFRAIANVFGFPMA